MSRPWRRALVSSGMLAIAVLFAAPPFPTLAHRYLIVEALQYALVGFAVPNLILAGWPNVAAAVRRLIHPRGLFLWRTLFSVICFEAVLLFWRLPISVNALARHGGLVAVEVATLVPLGVICFAQLTRPRAHADVLSPVARIAAAVPTMWIVWTIAYLSAMGRHPFYREYGVLTGRTLSAFADAQLSAGLLFLAATGAFIPFIFVNLMRFLGADEDPDIELRRLLRAERRRSLR